MSPDGSVPKHVCSVLREGFSLWYLLTVCFSAVDVCELWPVGPAGVVWRSSLLRLAVTSHRVRTHERRASRGTSRRRVTLGPLSPSDAAIYIMQGCPHFFM
ncbi:hypothetical protein QQF64_021507 [Cirrhinus molitorella]|uniref:Uncharacterized protein n=1 Tax=Cirrhinus molitorella TaxID=172907 RepID=A0ABR3L915_9TELE